MSDSLSGERLITRNPATGDVIQELKKTSLAELPQFFERARRAQSAWAQISPKKRASYLLDLREVLIDHTEELADLICKENGRPRFEALFTDILASVELITYFSKRGPRMLRDFPIPLKNPILKTRKSTLTFWPVGVVAVISPWNFPFFLPFGEITMALLAGNAVVFKPSEVTPLIGLKIQEFCDEAGFPPHLLQTVIGEGDLGAALIEQRPNKIFFTGSVETGKKVAQAAGKYLIPVNLELGGKDPMVVLPDANLDFATSAALWGGFMNSGQVCASTERILVHESMEKPFLEQLKQKLSRLHQGPSVGKQVDLGSITLEKQKSTYDAQLKQAHEKGAEFVAGGKFADPERRFLEPTIVTGPKIEELDIYRKESFGPMVAVTSFKTVAEAIQKANDSPYGLLASVITSNMKLGDRVARQIEAGTVTINEVTYTAGIPETPWGGVKDTGYGKKHSDFGLLEFVNVKHIHRPRSSLFVFKSWWWFPYTDFQYKTFRVFLEFYRRSWIRKLRALPEFLFSFVRFIKQEKRI